MSIQNHGEEPEPELIFDERRWEKIETYGEGYSPRTGHTVVSHQSSLYVFGGTDRRRRQQDLFQYDIESSTWCMVDALGTLPPRRSGALGVVHGSNMYIFGGYDGRDGNYFNDLFYFNFETQQWSEMPSQMGERPQPRTDHIMVLHDASIYVFGGYDGHTRYQNMYRYELEAKKWTSVDVKGDIPSRRFGHSGTVYEASGKLIVFGGWDGKDTLKDLYAYDFKTSVWEKLETTGVEPPHRYRHTSVIFQDSLFVFGGVDKQHCRYNDLQRLDLRTMVWSEVITTGFVPSSRTFHRAVVLGNLMYLLGGYDGTDRLHDLYSVHVGALTPSSLLSLSSSYIRKNYKLIAKTKKFDGIPSDVLDSLLWRRDHDHALRGECKTCPCNNFERVRDLPNKSIKKLHEIGGGKVSMSYTSSSSSPISSSVSSYISSSSSPSISSSSDGSSSLTGSPSPGHHFLSNGMCNLFRSSSNASSSGLSNSPSTTSALAAATSDFPISSPVRYCKPLPIVSNCICGHGNIDHSHIKEEVLFSPLEMLKQTANKRSNWYH